MMCLFSIERLTFMNERKNSLGSIIPSWDKKQDLFASNGFKCQCGKESKTPSQIDEIANEGLDALAPLSNGNDPSHHAESI